MSSVPLIDLNSGAKIPQLAGAGAIRRGGARGALPGRRHPRGGMEPDRAGGLVATPEVDAIAAKYGKTVAQVTLRWHIEHGRIIILGQCTRSAWLRTSTCSTSAWSLRRWRRSTPWRVASAWARTRRR